MLTSPVTSENNIMPSDHQSAAWLYGPPLKTSGAVQTRQENKCEKNSHDDGSTQIRKPKGGINRKEKSGTKKAAQWSAKQQQQQHKCFEKKPRSENQKQRHVKCITGASQSELGQLNPMGAKRMWGSHVALMQPHMTLPFMREHVLCICVCICIYIYIYIYIFRLSKSHPCIGSSRILWMLFLLVSAAARVQNQTNEGDLNQNTCRNWFYTLFVDCMI